MYTGTHNRLACLCAVNIQNLYLCGYICLIVNKYTYCHAVLKNIRSSSPHPATAPDPSIILYLPSLLPGFWESLFSIPILVKIIPIIPTLERKLQKDPWTCQSVQANGWENLSQKIMRGTEETPSMCTMHTYTKAQVSVCMDTQNSLHEGEVWIS